jgi:hypothetical protein
MLESQHCATQLITLDVLFHTLHSPQVLTKQFKTKSEGKNFNT